ncbi:hypothetical protein Syun_029175 [Stephania yunnanensis]|uniref:LysM domain-containing protein n=1 Tax=Stephania yunnanensis TaxID=152371 RepID=A0AAP0E555_9MAGN
MGCCCNEDDEDDILKTLITTAAATIAGTVDASAVISPMNSNFSALISGDILRAIFERLAAHDLARSACVCRAWHAVASDREILVGAFKAPWKLREVVGSPTSTSFWRDNCLGRFAISHKLVRGDTVASLAVKYYVQVMDIKRLNNMMSDHGIYSRERLLIPISKPELLINGTCYIELDPYAKREVAVLYLDGIPIPGLSSLSGRAATNGGKRRVIDSMRRSMQVDESTAEYYWEVSNGDARAAFSEFSEDLRWERQANPL